MTTPTVYGSATADGGVGPHPANAIVASGQPKIQYLYVETASEMYPGRFVKKGTNDNDIDVCGAGGKSIGVLGYEQASKKYRPTNKLTAYGAGDYAPVLTGPGVVVLLEVANGQTIVKGDKLVVAANGMVALASAAAPPSGSEPVLSTSAQPTMAGPMPTAGMIVAKAEESVTTVDEAGYILAELLI